jgi:hypothetical protein
MPGNYGTRLAADRFHRVFSLVTVYSEHGIIKTKEDIVRKAVYSLPELTTLESQILAKLICQGSFVIGIPQRRFTATRFKSEYRKLPYQAASEAGHATYLSQGFRFSEHGKPFCQ